MLELHLKLTSKNCKLVRLSPRVWLRYCCRSWWWWCRKPC